MRNFRVSKYKNLKVSLPDASVFKASSLKDYAEANKYSNNVASSGYLCAYVNGSGNVCVTSHFTKDYSSLLAINTSEN